MTTTINEISITGSSLNIVYKGSPSPTDKLSPLVASNNIKNYMNSLKKYIGNGEEGLDTAYGSDKSNTIQNFTDSVYLWNTFVNENNKLSCETVAIYNYTGGVDHGEHVPIKCVRSTYQGSVYLGILDSMFDSTNEELNKIELALLLGNAWNESGINKGIFNVCLQKNTPGYLDSLCTCNTCKGYDIKFVGRGLLQLSNPDNYIPVSYILNKMGEILKGTQLPTNYETILNNLPTAPLLPPLCGQKDKYGQYYPLCKSATPSDTNINCCQVPILDTQIKEVCNDINSNDKDNTIYTHPATICDSNKTPLSILTSFAYTSGNTSMAIKKNDYSFQVNSCSINQGGYMYPVKANDYEWLEKNGYTMTKSDVEKGVQKCISGGLEGNHARYEGFCTVMNTLFPGNNITSNNNWSITLKDGNLYKGNSTLDEAKLYYK